MAVKKSRYYSIILYPESLPINWLDILEQSGLRCAISPLHNRDIEDIETGVFKKNHYHCLCCWDGPTTYNNALSFASELNSNVVKSMQSVRGSYDYLTHKNNPDKAQYNKDDIIHINGFDINDYISLSENEKLNIKASLTDFIYANNIKEYYDFIQMVRVAYDNNPDFFQCASGSYGYFNSILKSNKWRCCDEEEPKQ